MSTELKPCPFCGSEKLDISIGLTEQPSDYIMCNDQIGCGAMISREDTQDGNLIAAWNRRTAPVSAPMGEELPPERIEQLWHEAGCAVSIGTQAMKFKFAAMIEREIRAPYAERIRQLERELAERKAASIGDEKEFSELVGAWSGAAHSCDKHTRTVGARQAWHALIAYIDGRTAGAAPEGWKLVPLKYTPEMRAAWDRAPQSEDDDSDFAGAYAALIAAAPTPMNSGKEEGK
jgi:hypothetical protein